MKFNIVYNFAAQAGVRYSFENPESYIDSNIIGFNNILNLIKKLRLKNSLPHLHQYMAILVLFQKKKFKIKYFEYIFSF